MGPLHSWPGALRSAVRLILDSKFAMCLAWGPDLALIYNDAFISVLGSRHPAALGTPARVVWKDTWPVVQPLIEKTLVEAETVYFEDQMLPVWQDGANDPAWYTYSYSPLRDDDDMVAGVLCVCSDNTANVLNQRRQVLRIEFEDRLREISLVEDIAALSTRIIGEHLRASRVVFAELTPDSDELAFNAEWSADGVASLVGRRFSIKDFRPELMEALHAGRTVITQDALKFGFTGGTDGSGPYADIGARAGITVPLIRETHFTGAFAVHSTTPRQWRRDEEILVREIAERAWDAIKRARAEMSRSESEQRFRNMASHAPVMIWTTDASGYCHYLNPAWYEFTGQSEQEAIGYGWLDATHPDDKTPAQHTFVSANAAQRAFRAEYRLRRRDGCYRWVIDSAAPRFGNDGSYLGYVGSVIDIDELKSAQDALGASNARFRAAIDAVEGVLWTNDAMGNMVGEQPGWESMTGQIYDEYVNYGWLAVVHPDDVQPTAEAWQRAVATRNIFVFEHRLRRKDGEWRHYSIRAIPTFDAKGEIHEWVGVHTDVTELRRTEDTLREVNAGLQIGIRQSTQERDRLWRMSQDVMAIASMNGYFLNVNPAFTAVLGWSEQEATSHPLLELTHLDDRADLLDKMAILAKGFPVVRYEIRDLHKDGGFRWLSWTIVPEEDRLYGVARDITLEKQQAAALRTAEEALRQAQKMEAVGQLTGGIAHDFNNLLASMVGNLEIMKLKISTGKSEDLGRHIDSAMTASDRAAALTHRLLAFSRRQTLDPKPVNVNALVASMIDMIQRTVGPSVEIKTRLANPLWATRCDPNQLESALLNLAINARDAMINGGKLLIETDNAGTDGSGLGMPSETRTGDHVTIRVTDTGTGMTAEVRERAFDPFFTTKPSGQGTGLGLSMIYGFVKQSGGDIHIESTPGTGTCVILMLPRHMGNEPTDESGAHPALPARATSTATLLIVDDEAPLRTLLAEMMTMLGYRTLQAADAAEAMSITRSGVEIDLLVSDVGLPGGMNGRQLADTIQHERPQLKVLFITGYAEDVATRNGMLEASMQVLTKPFAMDVFAARVRAMLEGRSFVHRTRLLG